MKKKTSKPSRATVQLTSSDLSKVSGGETIEVCVGHSDNLLNFTSTTRR